MKCGIGICGRCNVGPKRLCGWARAHSAELKELPDELEARGNPGLSSGGAARRPSVWLRGQRSTHRPSSVKVRPSSGRLSRPDRCIRPLVAVGFPPPASYNDFHDPIVFADADDGNISQQMHLRVQNPSKVRDAKACVGLTMTGPARVAALR